MRTAMTGDGNLRRALCCWSGLCLHPRRQMQQRWRVQGKQRRGQQRRRVAGAAEKEEAEAVEKEAEAVEAATEAVEAD